MKAVVYERTGPPDVLQVREVEMPSPKKGEVIVKVAFSGVNPTDWKLRSGLTALGPLQFPQVVPNQDGSGTITAVGEGVDPNRVGQRVWIWEAAHQRPSGTAQEFTALPSDHAQELPDGVSFEVGASVGVPALTAHRCLTLAENGPRILDKGALEGFTVLVHGGAGAVGHAAIQLAHWAGARVITTVSSPEKAALATAAGADHIVNYKTQDVTNEISAIAKNGVDIVLEVAPIKNLELDRVLLRPNGTIAIYANDGDQLTIPIRASMAPNLNYRFIMLYTIPTEAKQHAITGVNKALRDDVLKVGEENGLPLHFFTLDQTREAHIAVEKGITGKVLIKVNDN